MPLFINICKRINPIAAFSCILFYRLNYRRRGRQIGLEPMTRMLTSKYLLYAMPFVFGFQGTERIKSNAVRLRRSIHLSYHSHVGEWTGLEPATSGSQSEVTAFYNAVLHQMFCI